MTKKNSKAAKQTAEITPEDLGIVAAKAAAAAPKGKKGKKAAKPAKATKTADAKGKTAKPASTALDIHINKTGRVCFGKNAAARIGDLGFMTMTIDGKTVRLLATAKQADGSLLVRRANGRPYVSATKLLKTTGFDGKKALDITAAPFNSHGFDFKVA